MSALDYAEQTLDGTLPYEETWRVNAEAVLHLTRERDMLRDALRAIAANAEAWHVGEDGKARSLAVIARWARHPSEIPSGVIPAVPVSVTAEQEGADE
jgi:hypothetical protein